MNHEQALVLAGVGYGCPMRVARGTSDAPNGAMLSTDRAVLRNLVIAIVASTGGLLAFGTIFLGRDRREPQAETASFPGPQQSSVRSSAGGVAPAPVGTTRITSGQLERGTSASGSPAGAPTGAPFPQQPNGALPMVPFPQAMPHSSAPIPLPTQIRGAPTPMPAPTPTATPPTSAAPTPTTGSPIMGVSPMGSAPHVSGTQPFPAASGQAPTDHQQQPLRVPPQAPEGGAGAFMTEPPPFGASALTPNPEAGAGPFATEPPQGQH